MQQVLDRAQGVHLREVLPLARFLRAKDVCVRSCSGDWRSCQPGDLYVALLGGEEDGHDRVHEAIRRGAVAVLAERPLPVSVPTCLVDDTREAYGIVCQRLAGRPSERMRVIGVTGTHGKTSTSILVASVLRAARQQVGIAASEVPDELPGQFVPGGFAWGDLPTPPEVATRLAAMAADGATAAVLEASSQALATRALAGIQFDAAVLTNLRREHLDFHGSSRNYRRAKLRLLENFKPHGFAVVNADDPYSARLLKRLKQPVVTVALEAPAELTATVVERHPSEQTFLLQAGNETYPVRIPLVGDHQVYNALAAAAVGLVLGVDLPTIVAGLEAVDRLPRRLERIERGQPYTIFLDAADTPERLATALRSCRQVTRGRLICVYSARPDRDPRERPILGRLVEQLAQVGIVTSHHGQFEDGLSVAHEILDGCQRPGRALVSPNRRRAVRWALEQARPGDTVLVAGCVAPDDSAHLVTQHQQDERAVVRHWLDQQLVNQAWPGRLGRRAA